MPTWPPPPADPGLDPIYGWSMHPDAEHCPSCTAASLQRHRMEDWEWEFIIPRSPLLYCDGNCRCWFTESTLTASGDFNDIPLFTKGPLSNMPANSTDPTQHQVRLHAQADVTPAGQFEITAITAGKANGWTFTEDVLKASLELWDGVETFVDHAGWFDDHRSIRDLGGICYNPTWDTDWKGVKLSLRTAGPSGPLVEALGREMIAESGPKPRVGFSADVLFTAAKNEVKQILRVLSLDLVFDPARGGAFVRALNSVGADLRVGPSIQADPRQGVPMSDSTTPAAGTAAPPAPTTIQTQLQSDVAAVRTLLDVQREQQELATQADAARAVRAQMCAYLLDSGLAASRLPAAMQDHVRQQFTGRIFDPADLTGAIDNARKLVSALTGPGTVIGPRISGMFDTGDQLQAATYDLLQAPRDEGTEKLKPHRLQGIRELYHLTTGDYDFHGGYHADRASLATTADFTGLVKNALNKIVVNQWAQLGRAGYLWWQPIVVEEDFPTVNQVTGTLVGTVGTLPSVAEQGEYTELNIGDSPEVSSFSKYGGYVPLTLELIDRDETRKLRQYPKELAKSALRRLSGLVAAIFTDNAGIGPTLADTGALFNATAVTTAGGHLNLLTTALSSAQWEVVAAAVYNQPMLIKNAAGIYGTGAKMAIDPRYLLVPRALRLTGHQILYPNMERASNIFSENMQQQQRGDVLTVPEWTDADNWAVACDPAIAPAIHVGYRFGRVPEVFIAGDNQSPAVFMNDEHRLKVRFFLTVWANDFRPLHKENV